jgi:hypothetical protein
MDARTIPNALLGTEQTGQLPYPQAEAVLREKIDRITLTMNENPLEGLDQLLSLLQAVNMEMLKCLAPVQLENARITSDWFVVKGKTEGCSRKSLNELIAFARLQETIIKTGVAQTKVRDEIENRKHR